jgi:hypothetical protein
MSNGTDNDYPESFVPNRPSTFEAVFGHFTIGTTDGGEAPIAVIEIDGQERSLWLWQTALRNQFRRLRPKKGERLLVKIAGEKVKSGNGRAYWPDTASAPDRPVEVIGPDHPLFAGDEVEDGVAGDEDTEQALFAERDERDGVVDDHGTPITY